MSRYMISICSLGVLFLFQVLTPTATKASPPGELPKPIPHELVKSIRTHAVKMYKVLRHEARNPRVYVKNGKRVPSVDLSIHVKPLVEAIVQEHRAAIDSLPQQRLRRDRALGEPHDKTMQAVDSLQSEILHASGELHREAHNWFSEMGIPLQRGIVTLAAHDFSDALVELIKGNPSEEAVSRHIAAGLTRLGEGLRTALSPPYGYTPDLADHIDAALSNAVLNARTVSADHVSDFQKALEWIRDNNAEEVAKPLTTALAKNARETVRENVSESWNSLVIDVWNARTDRTCSIESKLWKEDVGRARSPDFPECAKELVTVLSAGEGGKHAGTPHPELAAKAERFLLKLAGETAVNKAIEGFISDMYVPAADKERSAGPFIETILETDRNNSEKTTARTLIPSRTLGAHTRWWTWGVSYNALKLSPKLVEALKRTNSPQSGDHEIVLIPQSLPAKDLTTTHKQINSYIIGVFKQPQGVDATNGHYRDGTGVVVLKEDRPSTTDGAEGCGDHNQITATIYPGWQDGLANVIMQYITTGSWSEKDAAVQPQ